SLRLSLPQPRARGHAHDGTIRGGAVRARLAGLVALVAVVASASACAPAPAAPLRAAVRPRAPHVRSSSERLAESLSGTLMQTQDGRSVRFYEELMKGKIVLINFMFTSCSNLCPMSTANLVK